MISAGVWRSGKRLVAVVVSDAGRTGKPMLVPGTEAEALAEHLRIVEGAEIVLPANLLREPIGRASAATEHLWVAPMPLIEAIRTAAALSTRGTAAMLARLPRIAALRSQLRRNGTDPRQLRLL